MNCAYCGTEFTDSTKGRLYCSGKCRLKRYKADKPPPEPLESKCGCCGKAYTVSRDYRKYCSEACRRIVKHQQDAEYVKRRKAGTVYKKRVEKVEKPKRIGTCVVCGVEYEKKHSIQLCCSSECSEVRNAANQRNKCAQDKVNKVKVEREPTPENEHKFVSRPGTGVVIKRAPDLPDSLFAVCEMCGKEYVKSVQAKGKCPVCRGIYHVDRVTWNHNRMDV